MSITLSSVPELAVVLRLDIVHLGALQTIVLVDERRLESHHLSDSCETAAGAVLTLLITWYAIVLESLKGGIYFSPSALSAAS